MATGTANSALLPPQPPTASPGAAPRKTLQVIERQLGRTKFHVKLVDLICRLAVLGVGVLAFLLVAAVVDHWIWPLGLWGRTGAFLLLAGGGIWFLVTQLAPLCLRRINETYAARAIEESQPTLKNSLINFLQLRQDRSGVREVVYEALEQRAAADIAPVAVESAVDRAPLIRIGYILVGVLALCAAYKIISPKDPFQTVARVVAPWADISRPSRVQISDVKPGDAQVYRGQKATISAAVAGVREGDPVTLLYSTADGQTARREVAMKAGPGGVRFECVLPPEEEAASAAVKPGLQQDVTYQIIAGDALTSEYKLTVVAAPTIVVEKTEYKYPAYTRKQPQTLLQGDVRGLEGTKVTIHANANQPIQAAYLEFDPAPRSGTPSSAAGEPAPRRLEKVPLQYDGQKAWGTITLQLNGDRSAAWHTAYQVRFSNAAGEQSEGPIVHSLEVIADLPPEVQLLAPAKKMVEVPENGRLQMEVRGVDPDFGLAKLGLRGTAAGKPPLEMELLKDAPQAPPQANVKYEFRPSEHQLKAGDELIYWAYAADGRLDPLTGKPDANEVKTAEYTLKIVAPLATEGEPETKPSETPMEGETNPDDAGGEEAKPEGAMPPENDPGSTKPQEEKPPQEKPGEQPKEGSENKGDQPKPGETSPPKEGEGKKNKKDKQKQPGESGSTNSGKSETSPGGSGGESGEKPEGEESPSSESQGGAGTEGSSGNPQQENSSESGGNSAGGSSTGKPGGNNSQQSGNEGDQSGGGGPPSGASSGPSKPEHEGEAIEEILKDRQRKESQGAGQGGKPSGSPQQGEQPSGAPMQGEEGTSQPQAAGPMDSTAGKSPDGQAPKPGQAETKSGPNSGPPKEGEKGTSASGSPMPGKSAEGVPADQPGEQNPAQPKPGEQNTAEQKGGKGTQPGEGTPKPMNTADKGPQPGGAGKEPAPKEGPGKTEKKTNEQKAADEAHGEGQSQKGTDGAGGNPQGPSKTNKEPTDKSGTGAKQGEKKNGLGKNGDSGAGNASKDKTGSGESQENSKDRPKELGPDGTKPESSEAGSPSNSKKQSDSKGSESGDKSGGGGKGAGQSGKQAGNDSAGSKSAADEGAGAAGETGMGETGTGKGNKEPAGSATGKSGNQAGEGSSTKADENGTQSGPSGQQPPGAPQKPQEKNAEGDPSKGPGGKAGTSQVVGGGQASDRTGEGAMSTAEVPDGEKANLEYARKATELALEHLRDQEHNPDPELLNRLGWTKEQMQEFLRRWDSLEKAAKSDPQAQRELDESLKSLGLRPATTKKRSGGNVSDNQRDLRDSGSRTSAPPSYRDQFDQFRKGIKKP